MTSAVVFAYHNVGVACLKVLLEHGIDVPLVVTHADNPAENIWFGSVADLAAARGIEVVMPEDPNTPEFIARVRSLKPDFLFSFYYRFMLRPELLALAPRGALNMHGSLLPKYRGRVPINWAVIKGETETGATLHEMVEKPDAGRIVDREAVPIGPDDTAGLVFERVTTAAALVLARSLPRLIDGSAVFAAQDLSQGSYFGGRKPEDGRIDWRDSARNIHNLVRGVAPPYPGATAAINGETVKITRTQLSPPQLMHDTPGILNVGNDMVIALCGDGRMLRLLEAEIDGMPHNEVMLAARFGSGRHRL
ncbi:MAG TPA: formyltransferase [Usitatibacteraceae bacterium]|nr:formyltransferase [Usitatibacteraceae bacterium]